VVDLKVRRREFQDFVWNHTEDAFQAKFDRCACLTSAELRAIKRLLTPRNLADLDRLTMEVKRAVDQNRSLVKKLLQLVGLTRNKILQDVKAVVRQDRLRVSTSTPEAIFNTDVGATLGACYLARQLQRVFSSAAVRIEDALLETVNQATWPGYIRQERAKRMGHEAEFRLACLLKDCGLPFAPQEKAENPLCRDVTVGEMSYDLVSPSSERALMRILSTVHTANIGQYGESKDDLEIRKAIAAMERAGDRKQATLVAFLDGVGFESNRAGLDGVLSRADEFCQFRTIWKAVVIAAACSKRSATVALPADQVLRFGRFLQKYHATGVDLAHIRRTSQGWIEAGDGLVCISRTRSRKKQMGRR